MSILIVDSDGSHAAVVKALRAIISCEILYYSDTRGSLDELSGMTRVSRVLTLLHTFSRYSLGAVVLLGRGMSNPPREAIDAGARRAGITLIHGVDLLVPTACDFLRPGALCVIGDSCLTESDLRASLGRRELVEIRSARLEPMYRGDDPLRAVLTEWKRPVGLFVLATDDNPRAAALIARIDSDVRTIDEFDVLAWRLAERLPEAPAASLRIAVTETHARILAAIERKLGPGDASILTMGLLEAAPMDGPYATDLDWDGSPA
jgi:hypothetical protein